MKILFRLIFLLLLIWALYDDQSFANNVGPIIAKLIGIVKQLIKSIETY